MDQNHFRSFFDLKKMRRGGQALLLFSYEIREKQTVQTMLRPTGYLCYAMLQISACSSTISDLQIRVSFSCTKALCGGSVPY